MELILNLSLVVTLASVLTLQSCSRTHIKDVPVTENVTFEKNIRPITSTVCVRCHTGAKRDYSFYVNSFRDRYTIKRRVVIEKTMPMGEYLSDENRALFRDWVDQGGKE